jgi:hypothetical protein
MPPPPPPGSTGSTPKHPSGNALPSTGSTGSTPGKHPDNNHPSNAILPPGLKQMLFRAIPVVTMTFLSWVLMNWTSSAAASYRFVCFGFASLCALTYFARPNGGAGESRKTFVILSGASALLGGCVCACVCLCVGVCMCV